MSSLHWLFLGALWLGAAVLDAGSQYFTAGYRSLLALRRQVLTAPAAAIAEVCTDAADAATEKVLSCTPHLTWWRHQEASEICGDLLGRGSTAAHRSDSSIDRDELRRAVANRRRYRIDWQCQLNFGPNLGRWQLPPVTTTLER